MSWVPSTDFEEEIVDSQPDHNFIFGQLCEPTQQTFYPRPKAHLEFVAQQKSAKNKRESALTNTQNHKLNLIARVQRIAGTKPLGEQPTINDWNDNDNVEREAIALMRHVGLGPSLEQPLDDACTIATHPITEEIKINRNGRKQMPVFFDEKFFELKPRVSQSSSSSGNNSPIIEDATNNINDSCSSQKSSSISTSSDLLNDSSTDSPNSGFESAIDIVGDEESFETAQSSENCYKSHNWRGEQNTQNWRNNDTYIKSQSWRSTKSTYANSNGIYKESANNVYNWRSSTENPRSKEKRSQKKSPLLCSPKELYEKKRQMS
ncbi:uncharacterized protein LOC105216962 [Zeugodacus cucurbitae]|uniref:Uncharacterized protein n=1 Tax=Zeugodacus cucurbitae TaxID=28588 RepID=A0A0A1XAX3_ZEUCU|nr:uncharacterized protein LOC105216962 [Zeugodacus cucurbitae]